MVYEFRFHPKNYSLVKTLKSGQLFRYYQIKKNAFHLVISDKICDVVQDEEFGQVSLYSEHREDVEFWRDFLSFEDPDAEEFTELMQTTTALAEAYKVGRGLRLLHQPAWETLVGFIISQRNNIPRIQKSIKLICDKLGSPLTLHDNMFPTPKALLPGTLNDCGLGYRESYVYCAAAAVCNNEVVLESLTASSGSTSARALQELERIPGVGHKVASCVALFSLGHTDLFPIDVWIERAIAASMFNYDDIARFGKHAGLVQQYVYYYMLRKNGREA